MNRDDVLEEPIVDSPTLVEQGVEAQPIGEEASQDRLHILVEEDEVAHHHGLVSGGLERGVRAEREGWLDRHPLDGDLEVSPRQADAVDVAGCHLPRLAEGGTYRLPVDRRALSGGRCGRPAPAGHLARGGHLACGGRRLLSGRLAGAARSGIGRLLLGLYGRSVCGAGIQLDERGGTAQGKRPARAQASRSHPHHPPPFSHQRSLLLPHAP